MTVSKLIELLNKAVDDGSLSPDAEVLAATLNGALQTCDESLMECVEKTNSDGFYILASIPDDPDYDVVFYTVNKEEETAI